MRHHRRHHHCRRRWTAAPLPPVGMAVIKLSPKAHQEARGQQELYFALRIGRLPTCTSLL